MHRAGSDLDSVLPLKHPGPESELRVLHQVLNADAQRLGDLEQRQDGHVVVAALNTADVTAVDLRQQGELLLSNAPLGPGRTDCAPKGQKRGMLSLL